VKLADMSGTFYSKFLYRLTPYLHQIICDTQCGFWHNRSTADQKCTWQIVQKKWEYTATIHQVLTHFRREYS
jgi:hypothetical protein